MCPPFFCLTRRREGAKKMKNGGLSCRSAAIHAADKKTQRGHFASREGAKARYL